MSRPRRMPKPRLQFRVYPEDRWLFFAVRVFRNLKDLRRYVQIERAIINPKVKDGTSMRSAWDARAVTNCVTLIGHKNGRARTDPACGDILFADRHLGGGVVAHEAAHATRYYLGRLKVPIEKDENDERFAWTVGNIVAQIGRRVWK